MQIPINKNNLYVLYVGLALCSRCNATYYEHIGTFLPRIFCATSHALTSFGTYTRQVTLPVLAKNSLTIACTLLTTALAYSFVYILYLKSELKELKITRSIQEEAIRKRQIAGQKLMQELLNPVNPQNKQQTKSCIKHE